MWNVTDVLILNFIDIFNISGLQDLYNFKKSLKKKKYRTCIAPNLVLHLNIEPITESRFDIKGGQKL